jgi:hypothetical protein
MGGKPLYTKEQARQRVLAALKCNGGSIESSKGMAVAELRKLAMPLPANLSAVFASLEAGQLVLRDLHTKSGKTGFQSGVKCYGIFLVNNDQEVAQWAINELDAPVVPDEFGGPFEVAEPVVIEDSGDPVAELAAELLRQVVDIITTKPVATVTEVESPKLLEELAWWKGRNGDLKVELSQQRIEVANLESANTALMARVAELDAQVASLQKRNPNRPSGSLSTKLGDVAPELWQKLQRQAPQR